MTSQNEIVDESRLEDQSLSGRGQCHQPTKPENAPFSILAIGHSHLIALLDGKDECTAASASKIGFIQLYQEQFKPTFDWDGQKGVVVAGPLVSKVNAALSEMSADAVILSLLGGEHYVWSMEGQARPFDVLLPFAPDLPRASQAELVPFALLQEFFETTIRPYLDAFVRFAEEVSIPVFLAMPPPPVASDDRLRQRALPPFDALVAAHGIPARPIRMKLWLLWREVARRAVQNTSVTLLDPPSEALDADGFLTEAFCYSDAVHGNAQYGAMVWQQVLDRLEAMP